MSVSLTLVTAMWLTAAKLQETDISANIASWMRYSGSMTQRLRENADHVNVKVLQHQWEVVDVDDANYLNITPHTKAIVRKVVIYGNDQPWVYAVCIFPEGVVALTNNQLVDLGDKPLGEILFSRSDIHRGEFQFTQLNNQQTADICQRSGLPASKETLWARRSYFELQGQKLSLFEVFLPPLIEKIQ